MRFQGSGSSTGAPIIGYTRKMETTDSGFRDLVVELKQRILGKTIQFAINKTKFWI